ncbi:MAG: hypothetical protein HOE90_08380 [Bacteriovoracaceae bacterium]|jgi:glutathione synthase|nr:hypothetical protein [Bacteriovoracaceae bacterium]
MKAIIYLNNLEKLVIQKDSTLLFALTLKENGVDTYLLFEDDFYYSNMDGNQFKMHPFSGSYGSDTFYVDQFDVGEAESLTLDAGDNFFMRLDPPFDLRYMRSLWYQNLFSEKGVNFHNHPLGVMANNEKLVAYGSEYSHPSFVGGSVDQFLNFTQKMKDTGFASLIIKPLDLYQGIGVEKVSLSISEEELKKLFIDRAESFGGSLVVQPFIEKITSGEVRSTFYKGAEVGSILKVPKEGSYLANIAQGATFSRYELTESERASCQYFCEKLMKQGVDWLAFDLLDGKVSEVNITCPGLLVETSKAYGVNLCEKIVGLFLGK